MIEPDEKPLITFFVCAYNQEHFIREAVEGAFAQTYSPLEIILSDDCSPDKTFEIMQEMAAAYRGPHRVVLNRNPYNLGTTGHVNRIVSLSTGRLMVGEAGDDVSLRDRVQILYDAWLADGSRARFIYSNVFVVNSKGKEMFVMLSKGEVNHALSLEEAVRRSSMGIIGCSGVYSREVFDIFGPLHEGGMIEDHAIGFRSLILAPILYVEAPLVRYRQHDGSVKMGARLKLIKMLESVLCGWMADITVAREKNLIPAARADSLQEAIASQLRELKLEIAMSQGGLLLAIRSAIGYLRKGVKPGKVLKALYRSRCPRWVKRCHKLVCHDLFHPRDLMKSIIHTFRG
jgi:glycosyltransferase involved in cell wall biosynthesis